jgi:hypothetical protein
LRAIKSIVFWILSIIVLVIITISVFVLISAIQENLFLPEDYIMWIYKSPFSSLMYIYEFYIIFGFAYLFNKDVRLLIKEGISLKTGFIKRYKALFIYTFMILNIVLIYTIIFNVAVISSNRITNYTFLLPQGKEYSHKDVVKIETGIYGKKQSFLTMRSRGEFYYIIELNDGTRIDLAEMGGAKNEDDPRFIIEKLDRQYVDMGILKVSSMENFQYTTKSLDKIYTDKIRNILENTGNRKLP